MSRFLLLLLSTLIGCQSREFDLKLATESECDAVENIQDGKIGGRTYVGNSKYRVVEANIYWTNANGKILGYTSCNVPGAIKCDGEITPEIARSAAKRYLSLTVTLVKSSFEDQFIHYQYFDELFHLSELDDPSVYDAQPGTLNNIFNFLYPASATYTGNGETLKFTAIGCRQDRAKSMLSGHGYFITEFGDRKVWEPLYYLPGRVGQYLTIPK